MMKGLFTQSSTVASSLVHLLRFVVRGEHPRRREIAAAYVRLHLRMAFSKKRALLMRSFRLLGTEMHFADARIFSFLMWELFIEESYRGCQQPPATIVDCGSNMGMSILLFKSLWPSSRIVGVEASPETFSLLKRNVSDFSNVTVMNKAVSDRNGQVAFYSTSGSLLGSTNALRGGGQETVVEAVRLSELVSGGVDLLKIDIEGSESAALAELEASGKMPLVRQMFIEYHHHLPGEVYSLSGLLERLERCGFDYELAASMPARSGDFQDVVIRAKRRDVDAFARPDAANHAQPLAVPTPGGGPEACMVLSHSTAGEIE